MAHCQGCGTSATCETYATWCLPLRRAKCGGVEGSLEDELWPNEIEDWISQKRLQCGQPGALERIPLNGLTFGAGGDTFGRTGGGGGRGFGHGVRRDRDVVGASERDLLDGHGCDGRCGRTRKHDAG